MSTFQTGRTAGKNALRLGAGINVGAATEASVLLPYDDAGDDNKTIIPMPTLELWARYGLRDNLDLGLRLYSVGVSGEVKIQVAGDQKSPFAAAMGVTVNYFGYSRPEPEEDTEEVDWSGRVQLLDFTTSVYLSYTLLNGWFNFYLAPKYVSRNVTLGATVEDTGGQIGINNDLAGTGLGIAIGRDFSLYVEGGAYVPIGFDGTFYDVGIGFDF
ncbi:MAG: hypothetical protein V2A73_03245 [Pseudomonadota bacterium]